MRVFFLFMRLRVVAVATGGGYYVSAGDIEFTAGTWRFRTKCRDNGIGLCVYVQTIVGVWRNWYTRTIQNRVP